MLFLLMQVTIASAAHGQNVGLSGPWTEYVKMLPSDVPVPTMWTEEERIMLLGTSLEVSLLVLHCAEASKFSQFRRMVVTVQMSSDAALIVV